MEVLRRHNSLSHCLILFCWLEALQEVSDSPVAPVFCLPLFLHTNTGRYGEPLHLGLLSQSLQSWRGGQHPQALSGIGIHSTHLREASFGGL